MSTRAEALAQRLELGADALSRLVQTMTDAEWTARVPRDGRSVGVVVHHVAEMYPVEIALAQTLGRGEPIVGLTWQDVHEINARHAAEHATVTKGEALELLRVNAAAAAEAIRAFSDSDLDRAAAVSMYSNAPLTCQFFIEDHALRHSFHHLAGVRRAIESIMARAA